MDRLTIEQLEYYRNTYDKYDGIESNEFDKICNELIEYKNLDEQLGCPLDVVFKAIVDGIVIIGDINKYTDMTLWLDTKPTTALIGEKHDFEEPRLITYKEWCFSCNSGSYSGCVKLKDYKKNWWLKENREEKK